MVEHLVLEKVYRVSATIKTRCCTHTLQPGDLVKVVRQTSPNRVLVGHQTEAFKIGSDGKGWCGHKVRKSTLRMSVEELADGSKEGG